MDPELSRLPQAIARIREAARGHDLAPRPARPLAADETARGERARVRVPQVAAAIRRSFGDRFLAERRAWERLVAGLDGAGLPVAVLSACGHGTAEVRFTQLIRHFLDPRAPHGLGSRPLRALFGERFAEGEVRVEAEVCLATIRQGAEERSSILDLLVATDDEAILVEQKLFSAEAQDVVGDEREGQLSRYSQAFALSFPAYATRCRKFFLTPTGRAPTDDVSWKPVSHAEWIAKLATIIDDPTLSAMARFNLVSFLWELLAGPLAADDRLPELGGWARSLLADPGRLPYYRRRAAEVLPELDLLLRITEAMP